MGFHLECVRRRLLKLGITMRAAKRRPPVKQYKKKRFSQQGVERMVYLYVREGKCLREIGLLMHTSRSTVGRELVKAGVTLRKPKKRPKLRIIKRKDPILCDADMEELKQDRLLGISWKEIGEHYKLSRSQIYKVIRPQVEGLISA